MLLTIDGGMALRKEAVSVRQPDDNGLALGDNGRCNNTALRKATRRVSQLYDSVLAPTGLRSTQRSILLNIARFGSPTMGQLAASLVLDRSALGHNLRPLEREGFIVLDVDPDDKRSRLAKKQFARDRATRRSGWRRISYARTMLCRPLPVPLEQRVARRSKESS